MKETGDSPLILYIVVGVIVLCAVMIFTVEIVYYNRAKRRLIYYFQNYDIQEDPTETQINLML